MPPRLLLALTLSLTACGGADEAESAPPDLTHHHDHGVIEDHQHEATEPCTADNWRELDPNLRQCALAGNDLAGESLRRVDLTDADLAGATLTDSDLFDAVLVRTSLKGALVERTNLTNADLRGADLSGARLVGATLTNANLYSALLNGAITDDTTTCPDGTGGPCW